MQCRQYRELIHEQVDGALSPFRRAELEAHLDRCEDCRALAADLRTLQEAAAALEPIAPPDRVWLQVAGRLRQEGRVSAPAVPESGRGRHTAWLALAAALVLAVGASIVTLLPVFRSNNGGPATTASAEPQVIESPEDAIQSVEAEFRLAEQHYQNAISKLEQAARLDQAPAGQGAIDPQTAAMLQKNLRVIDQAIAESRVALRSEPQSAPARDSLFDALKRKVGLLQNTIALMNEMRKGNSAGAAQLVDSLNKS